MRSYKLRIWAEVDESWSGLETLGGSTWSINDLPLAVISSREKQHNTSWSPVWNQKENHDTLATPWWRWALQSIWCSHREQSSSLVLFLFRCFVRLFLAPHHNMEEQCSMILFLIPNLSRFRSNSFPLIVTTPLTVQQKCSKPFRRELHDFDMHARSQWTVCKIQRHLGLPGSVILKVLSLVSRLLDREALVHAHQYKSERSL